MGSKKIGLSGLLLVMALMVSFVPFAWAAAPEYQAEQAKAALVAFGPAGGHEYYIRVTNEKGANIDAKCGIRTANVASTIAFPTASIQTTIGFSECKLNGEEAFGYTNGCEYKFNLVAASSPATATLDILCPSGKEIEFEVNQAGKCKITIPEQKGLKHVIYSNNEGAIPDVTETFSITGLKYTIKKTCPEQAKEETKTNGIYTDGLTRQALVGGIQVGFWVE